MTLGHVSLDPPKSIFSGDYISALSAHHKPGRGLPKKFKGEHLKFSLKISIRLPITLGVVGVTSRNFTMRLAHGRGDK